MTGHPASTVRALGAPAALDLRSALGSFTTGVTVVTSSTGDGEHHATTANSFTSVSLDPPLVLVCLGNESRGLSSILRGDAFAVNVLSRAQEHLSAYFADPTRPAGPAALARVDYSLDANGCPRLEDSLASFACRVHAVHPGGDHAIVVGEVVDLVARPHDEPLVFHAGGYRRLAAASRLPRQWAS